MRAAWGLLTTLALAGCALIDQTTFAPSPEAEPAAAVEPPKVDPRAPLLVVGFAEPDPHYQDMLRYAVRAAETRAPGVQYDVVATLPPTADTAAAQTRATEVMRAIMAQGVPASRIHLGLRSTPASSPQQIRVYVR